MEASKYPLVTIGIPTYNRAHLIAQTLQSAVDQDYPNLEIIVSDNASIDQTSEICESFCTRYKNVKYIRQPSNQGGTENFNLLLKMATGYYFMWLGDDDWIDNNYITACVNRLLTNPDASIVAGQAKYYGIGDSYLYTGIIMNLDANSQKQRVLDYFATVKHNGIFYGVMPKDLIMKVGLTNVMGGDLLTMASLIFQGKVYTLETCSVHRRRGGISSNSKKLTKSMNLSWFDYYFPRLSVAKNVFQYIMHNNSFSTLGISSRFFLSMQCIFYASLRKLLSVLFKRKFTEQSVA